MRVFCSLILTSLITVNGYAQVLTSEEEATLKQMEADYAQNAEFRDLAYPWLLYRTGTAANCATADSVLRKIITLQDDDLESTTYGQWGWRSVGRWREGDLNNALFRADVMFVKLWTQQDKMSPEAREQFLTACRRLTEAAKRRWDTEVFDIGRDFTCYSNIFVLYVETLTLAGERFENDRLKKMAQSQWTRWYNHISFYGIDEFASPTYNHVIFFHLKNIYDFCHDERIQAEVKEVMDHLYLLQSAITHPVLKLPVCGISRDYRNFLQQADARSEVLSEPMEGYTPPPEATRISERREYPFEVIGKASVMPFVFKSYQLQDAAMGSMTGGNCFQQQIHCMAAVGRNENERAVVFLQGSFTPVNGYTDQIGVSTLCVYNRLPNYWHLTQWRGDMAEYKKTFGEFGIGLTPNWKEKQCAPGHIVLEAFGYDIHFFPFSLEGEKVAVCPLVLEHRTTTSPRYHPRPRVFDEYVFPEEPEWFGAYIALVKSGVEVADPGIVYANENGIRSFTTNAGHQVRLFVAEKGDTKQLFNVDPVLIPQLKIGKAPETP